MLTYSLIIRLLQWNGLIQSNKRRRTQHSLMSTHHSWTNLVSKGHATEVSEEHLSMQEVWYAPLRCFPPGKEQNLYGFYCVASFQSQSLNRTLLSRPDLTNSLIGVLSWSRVLERIPVTADIESKFYQVKVPEAHQSYLRFRGGQKARSAVHWRSTKWQHMFSGPHHLPVAQISPCGKLQQTQPAIILRTSMWTTSCTRLQKLNVRNGW